MCSNSVRLNVLLFLLYLFYQKRFQLDDDAFRVLLSELSAVDFGLTCWEGYR